MTVSQYGLSLRRSASFGGWLYLRTMAGRAWIFMNSWCPSPYERYFASSQDWSTFLPLVGRAFDQVPTTRSRDSPLGPRGTLPSFHLRLGACCLIRLTVKTPDWMIAPLPAMNRS